MFRSTDLSLRSITVPFLKFSLISNVGNVLTMHSPMLFVSVFKKINSYN